MEEGLNAAAAIGDDRIQRMGWRPHRARAIHATARPHSAWNGSAAGSKSGRLEARDTFGGS